MPRCGIMSNQRIAKNLDDMVMRNNRLRGMIGERACNNEYVKAVYNRLGQDSRDYAEISRQLKGII